MNKKVGIIIRIILSIAAVLCIAVGFVGFFDYLWVMVVYGALLLAVFAGWRLLEKTDGLKKLRTVFLVILAVITMVEAGMMTAELIVARNADIPSSETPTVIILGCDVKGDEPGTSLKQRLDAALTYLKGHPASDIIVSGKGVNEKTEAEVMASYLIKHGVPAEQIILEDRAGSTTENLAFSADLISEKGLSKDVVIVTNNYHQLRASILAKKEGLSARHVSAKPKAYLFIPMSVREHFIIIGDEWLHASLDLVNKNTRTE